jgi:hypothetical protein
MDGESNAEDPFRDVFRSALQTFRHQLRLYNIAFAISGAALLAFDGLRGDASRELALSMTTAVFTAGAILGEMAERKSRNVASQSEIEKLIHDADELFTQRGAPPPDVRDMSALISAVSLGGACFCWLMGIAMAMARAPATHSYWPAVTVVLVGEAIYLSCCFERSAKKAELEALASKWKECSAGQPYAKLSWSWANRAKELGAAVEQEPRPR